MSGKTNYPFYKVLLRVIPIQLKAAPFHNLISMLMGVLHALPFALEVVAAKYLFDAITAAATGSIGFWECLPPLLALAGVAFWQQIMNGVDNFFVISVLFPTTAKKITAILHQKLTHIDPAEFEDTVFLDDLNKAREGASAVPFFNDVLFAGIPFNGTYFITIGVYLFSLKPMLLLALLMAFIPSMLSQIIRAKVFTRLEDQIAPLRRKCDYYQKTMCDREYFKETRIIGAYKFFHKLLTETTATLISKQWKAERNTALLQLLLNLTSFAGMAAASYMLFDATLTGGITVGAFAAVFTALGRLFHIMQEIMGRLSSMNRDVGKIVNFIRVLDMRERTGKSGIPNFNKGIIAENISFTYPGRNIPAVNDVSLTIANGETIAIVGENGAGKSTLTHLLTGLYQPSEGTVTIGGLNTIETDPVSVYSGISGVFQKYQRYKMTFIENITISEPDTEIDNARVESALKQADAEINADFNVMLSPEFDGIDLSGGQWQRVAIARGLYRTNAFIVLDEPTSAIDPIEETRIFTQFQRLVDGKCAIVVTHRLGSAKMAHRIVVMEAGKIVDVGTHDELLARPGKYADMWVSQAQWYERQPDFSNGGQYIR